MIRQLLSLLTTAVLFPLFFVSCTFTDKEENNTSPDSLTSDGIKKIDFSVIRTLPHDTTSFTQGLIVYKGRMYEGTGGNDSNIVSSKLSRLLELDINNGKILRSLDLDKKYFGEGITILNDTIYQLTWTGHTVFIYDMHFKKLKESTINTEGWGLTNNGKELILSDGTSNLYFYEPHTFRLLRTLPVMLNDDFLHSINELEFINGAIYANQWGQPYIFKIDPASGRVTGRIDVTPIWDRIKKIAPELNPRDDVPNGIAYDQDSKKIYITGKKWPELYEVRFGN
ncbi:glutaminyl-peptide cyclotransferase [Niabella beijingensis]|uniref:glutaminyl-peptide cyclotransferase n=1 Tax=Niabella beijingensis TaxID=2872700 RepID=UPI001CBC332F|nr:glutaminyl-peptide cyclotransferase [Niabella beijingensis]MBZ4192358.1 glutaminyl-peptide cyclotransferase [Niabella beijingensis]